MSLMPGESRWYGKLGQSTGTVTVDAVEVALVVARTVAVGKFVNTY